MKPIFILNTMIFILFMMIIGFGAIFSEKVMCYGEYVSWDSSNVKSITPINNGGCLINQKKLSTELGIYQETYPFGGSVHLFIKYILLFSIVGTGVYLLSFKNWHIFSGVYGSIKMIAIYLLSLLLFSLIASLGIVAYLCIVSIALLTALVYFVFHKNIKLKIIGSIFAFAVFMTLFLYMLPDGILFPIAWIFFYLYTIAFSDPFFYIWISTSSCTIFYVLLFCISRLFVS